MALSDQNLGYLSWLIDAETGQLHLWSDDVGLDVDERGLQPVGPIRSTEWYQVMADFADQVGDERSREMLGVALDGRGAFRRFRDVYQRHPELLTAWRGFEQARGRQMAVDWLASEGLVEPESAEAYLHDHPTLEVT